jgi:hypothetical protein
MANTPTPGQPSGTPNGQLGYTPFPNLGAATPQSQVAPDVGAAKEARRKAAASKTTTPPAQQELRLASPRNADNDTWNLDGGQLDLARSPATRVVHVGTGGGRGLMAVIIVMGVLLIGGITFLIYRYATQGERDSQARNVAVQQHDTGANNASMSAGQPDTGSGVTAGDGDAAMAASDAGITEPPASDAGPVTAGDVAEATPDGELVAALPDAGVVVDPDASAPSIATDVAVSADTAVENLDGGLALTEDAAVTAPRQARVRFAQPR